jgi:hypothetical protein
MNFKWKLSTHKHKHKEHEIKLIHNQGQFLFSSRMENLGGRG